MNKITIDYKKKVNTTIAHKKETYNVREMISLQNNTIMSMTFMVLIY